LLIVILKLLGLEMPGLGFNDVRGQIRHVLRNLFIFDVVEIFVFFAHLVWISQGDAEKTLAARFERHDMLSREVKTTRASATMPSLRIAPRMTANVCWPTSPSGTM